MSYKGTYVLYCIFPLCMIKTYTCTQITTLQSVLSCQQRQDRETDWQAERAGRQTDRQAGRQADRQTERNADRWKGLRWLTARVKRRMEVRRKTIRHCWVTFDPCHYAAVRNVTLVCVDCVCVCVCVYLFINAVIVKATQGCTHNKIRTELKLQPQRCNYIQFCCLVKTKNRRFEKNMN